MAAALLAVALVLAVAGVAVALSARARVGARPAVRPPPTPTQVRTEAAAIVGAARAEALASREAVTEEVGVRSAALEARRVRRGREGAHLEGPARHLRRAPFRPPQAP